MCLFIRTVIGLNLNVFSIMRFTILLLELLIVFSPLSILGIFTDEAYQIDYHHSLLGLPQPHTTYFHRPSAASKASLLYTLSDKGVLGAINPKDGSVVWRQRLLDPLNNKQGNATLSSLEGVNTVYSAIGNQVQAWDAADGRLLWSFLGNGEVKALGYSEKREGVISLDEEAEQVGVVRKLAADTGKVVWEFRDERYCDSGIIGMQI